MLLGLYICHREDFHPTQDQLWVNLAKNPAEQYHGSENNTQDVVLERQNNNVKMYMICENVEFVLSLKVEQLNEIPLYQTLLVLVHSTKEHQRLFHQKNVNELLVKHISDLEMCDR